MQEAQAPIRKPLSKTTRFNVFKRDSFRCQYCGQCPPAVVLEVDHITPVSKGGGNTLHNLLTACFDCNRGKAAGLLTEIPQSLTDKAAVLQEKQDQLRAFEKLLKKLRSAEEARIDSVESVFKETFDDRVFTGAFRESIRKFLEHLDIYQVTGAMKIACGRRSDDAGHAIKYFCGICWSKIKEQK